MSEPDDDAPDKGDAKPKSLFERSSNTPAGSSERPLFAPPSTLSATRAEAKTRAAPEVAPRTSATTPLVSGDFEAPAPRPEPTTPPRVVPPEGVSPDYDPHDTPQQFPSAPSGPVTVDELGRLESERLEAEAGREPGGREPEGRKADGESEDPDDPLLRFRREYESPIPAEPERDNGTLRSALILLAIATAIVVGFLVIKSARDKASHAPPSSRQLAKQRVERPSSERPMSERPASDHGQGTDTGETSIGTDTGTDTGDTGTDTGPEPEPEPRPPAKVDDPRDPSVVPPGTPEDNAKAFFKLPVSIHDGPPIGGIGRSGVHIDKISMAHGRENSDCSEPTRSFSISEAEYVNVCIRVVHPREQEYLRVLWEKDGKVTRRGPIRIPDLHAYATRAYLLMRPEYVGSWRVRILPDGEDIELAVATFEITQ
jgi:hypothetical protein